jgi:hypothetical protein
MYNASLKTLTFLTCCTAPLPFAVSPSNAFVLPDTGQSKCYATVTPYAEINCSDTGQDGMYSSNVMSYTPNGNGTVTDNNTNLMWQQQDGGVKTWADAVTYCSNLELAGFTDWRLASKKELLSIVDYGIKAPAAKINNGFFPGTNANAYWTSTPLQGSTGTYWYVTFSDGGSGTTFHPEYTYNVRCVRGEQYSQSLTDNGNGTVTDSGTGLIWQQGEPGEKTWADALAYCNNLVLPESNGYSDWRLPNIKELESLSLETRRNPSFNYNFFPGYHSDSYWSSTSDADPDIDGYNYKAWRVYFYLGVVTRDNNKTYAHYVRCIRGGAVNNQNTGIRIEETESGYASIQGAYDAAATGQTIQARTMEIAQELELTRGIDIALKGGYTGDFSTNPGMTTIAGSMTLSGSGTVTIENFAIKNP